MIKNTNPDIICLQEIKMNDKILNEYEYFCYYNFANKKGYSGVMIFTREKPLNVQYQIGLDRFDKEGRFILLEYDKFILINIYIPLGFVDSFRCLVHDDNIYSMWTNGFHARERNMGWRIDYIFTSQSLEKGIKDVKYLKGQLGSDHCPYIMDIEIPGVKNCCENE